MSTWIMSPSGACGDVFDHPSNKETLVFQAGIPRSAIDEAYVARGGTFSCSSSRNFGYRWFLRDMCEPACALIDPRDLDSTPPCDLDASYVYVYYAIDLARYYREGRPSGDLSLILDVIAELDAPGSCLVDPVPLVISASWYDTGLTTSGGTALAPATYDSPCQTLSCGMFCAGEVVRHSFDISVPASGVITVNNDSSSVLSC